MIKSIFILLLSLAVVAIVYLPYRQQGATFVAQKTSLSIDMTRTTGVMIDRNTPEKKFRLGSDALHYDEATDSTQFTPFHLVGNTGNQSVMGDSLTAILQGDQFILNKQVTLQQAALDKPTRVFTTEQLIMDIKQHKLNSPSEILMTDQQQQIQADSLIGNYEEGWYEFTQHVQSHWQ
ncbi:MAG: LPS export ABC transporter periplasmic protein LptC [Thiotrichales bacterium]|jgi:LPS export ABC transporter protein LptC|nr:LPS export ABC transporter periplasmic protein LptC [Thiotrichales bacterium]